MLNLLNRQPPVIIFAAVLTLCTGRSYAAEPGVEVERELTAARATHALLQGRNATPEEWAKMRAIYRDLAARYPRDARVLNAYGALLWNRGEMEEAEALFRKANTLAPDDAESLAGLATAALAGGDVREAARLYSRASVAAPKNARLHFDLANVLFLFRHDLLDITLPDAESVIIKAMTHYGEACRLAPENVDFARGHAETFYGMAKPDWNAALEAWRHLHKISSQKDFALANLATIHLKLGQKDAARDCVRQMSSAEFARRKARLSERIEQE